MYTDRLSFPSISSSHADLTLAKQPQHPFAAPLQSIANAGDARMSGAGHDLIKQQIADETQRSYHEWRAAQDKAGITWWHSGLPYSPCAEERSVGDAGSAGVAGDDDAEMGGMNEELTEEELTEEEWLAKWVRGAEDNGDGE